jgi:acetyl esterase/lipase
MRTINYGPSESQVGDLYLPNATRPPVVCLLHGGFWRMPYGRQELDLVARDLASRNFAVWNLEYRRIGEPDGGWPGTFEDVAAGIDHLASLVVEGIELDLGRLVVVGHSAGGHLALWSSARDHRKSPLRMPARVRPAGAVGLAAVVDLARAFSLGAGDSAVGAFLEGSPDQQPARYAAASPIALLPLGVNQLIVHGGLDEVLPVELAREYVQAARAAGDSVQFPELPRAGHMDFLDPGSDAHATLCAWLEQFFNRGERTHAGGFT